VLKGKLINLTAVERDDLSKLMEWRNKSDYRKYFREYREINSTMQENWFEKKVISDDSTIMFSIRKNDTNELLGCCGLCYINWINGSADLSLYIGWENAYIDKEGFAKESCELLFQYGFNELRLNRIWTEIYEIDNKKRNLYDDLGMKVDGILRESYFFDGQFCNSYIYSLLKKDFINV
jgi:RimJ/RimL family protein N-acetyltransferase